MPIVAADLLGFLSVNMPENDAATSGGAISLAGRFEITDIAATDTIEALSDGADVRNITIVGRLASGAIASETIALNGVTFIVTTNSYERVLKVTLASADASRTVTVRRATGDVLICTLGPNITKQIRLFYDSTSEVAQAIRYEKVFMKNNHGTLALTAAAIKLTSDPATRYKIGGDTAVDATVSVATRKTAPGGVTFVDDNVSQSVPSGQLTAGQAIGVWVQQDSPANDPAHKNTLTLELAGSTT